MPAEPFISRERTFRFGPFELSEHDGELRKSGSRIKLQEQPFRLVLELVANAGKVVTREELQQKLWQADTFVDFDVGLNTAIRKLRQALGDDADEPRYIETLAKRGYRFVAPVTGTPAAPVPITIDPAPAIGDSSPPINASPASSLDSPPSDSRERTLPDAGGVLHSAAIRRKLRWYWVLAASCALALLIYGVFAYRPGSGKPRLATEQRITANPPEAPITSAVVSLDGKYVAYADPTGIYIRHIDSGEIRQLSLPKGFDAVPTSWFPDGTHLLLSSGEAGEAASLWKVSILGGSPQKVMEDATEGMVSPDGSKIAFLRGALSPTANPCCVPYGREIWLVDTNGSHLRRLADTAMEAHISRLAWSPDGRRIAYFRVFALGSTATDSDKFTLETIDINGGPPKALVSSVQFRPALSWAADGRLFYAYRDDPSSESSDYGIWSVRVNEKTGEPGGKPMQLTKGVGRIGGLSVTADGTRLIAWRVNAFPEVFLTEIDRETRRLKMPRRLTLDENWNIVTAWTPDSTAVLFYSARNGTWQLFRQTIDRVTPEVLVEGRSISVPRLNADGTQILYLAGPDPEDPAHLVSVMRVPLQGGSPRLLMQKPFILNIQCARSPSKLCLLNTGVGSSTQFFSFDPEDGKTREFASFQVSEQPNWSLSPDGSQLALILYGPERKVTFMAVGDKGTHEVELNQWPRLNYIDWAFDGKGVFVTSQTATGVPVVLNVEPDGDHRVLLEGDKGTWYWWCIPSPDGRYVALEEVTGENNVWMVENF